MLSPLQTLSLVCACAIAASALTIDETKHIFVFGDSYTAVGYDPKNGLRPEDQEIRTLSGGLNWINYLAAEHGLTNSTWDFAVNSATTDSRVIKTHTHDLVYQVDSFLEYFSPPPEDIAWDPATTLFPIFIGINDNGHAREHGQSFSAKFDLVREAYDTQLKRLYDAGARHFLLMGLPPMERTPYVLEFPAVERAIFGSHLTMFNAYLANYASHPRFSEKFPEGEALYYDTYGTISAILDEPASYGFKVSTEFCWWYAHLGQDPDTDDPEHCLGASLKEFVFYDEYHLSWAAQALLGKGVGNALSATYSSDGFKKRSEAAVAEPRAVRKAGKRSRHFGKKEWKWSM